MVVRVSKHIIVKPKKPNVGKYIDVTGIDKGKALTGGGLGIGSSPMCQEVSRGYSSQQQQAMNRDRGGLTS